MFLNTIVYNETQYDSVKRSISTYRENFMNFNNELEKRVCHDEELKYFYSNITSENIKVSILDKVASDKVLQKRYSTDLLKYFNFYSNILSEETSFLKDNSNLENSINILHSNNDKLQTKLQEIYTQFEKKFSEKPHQNLEFNNILITLPEGDNNEVNKVDRIDFSNRISLRS
ncbi:hypothetical protein [Streptococcus salivarius]|jgi:hypothetical protein|uniref:Uncharacterized protein n=1 Tax=Streptococcus salivarius TaxID=1304 RepID=A0A1R3T5M0_STRSL|nr:hypothetical protein [Streptococcus salivarius]SCW21002.1 hypothetical protein [Streptococcus salivarius]